MSALCWSVGQRRCTNIERDALGQWTLTFNPAGIGDLRALAAAGANDMAAAGTADGSANVVQRTGASWAYASAASDLPGVVVNGLWAAPGGSTYYAVGLASGGITGVIYRGTR